MLQTPLDDTDGPLSELYPPVAAVASIYGDPDGKYAAFLANGENTYPDDPYFLWNQPLSDSGLSAATVTMHQMRKRAVFDALRSKHEVTMH